MTTIAKPSLTKADLTELLYDRVGVNKREAKDIVDAFFGQISEVLIAGEPVRISGFGNFQLRDKAARPGRNPKTIKAVCLCLKIHCLYRFKLQAI